MEHHSHDDSDNQPPKHIQDNIISSTNIPHSTFDGPEGQAATSAATISMSTTRTYLDVHVHPTLSRVDSTASFVAEACHIEDVNTGCQLHSHPSDIALSRYTVVNGIILREGQQQHRLNSNDGTRGRFFLPTAPLFLALRTNVKHLKPKKYRGVRGAVVEHLWNCMLISPSDIEPRYPSNGDGPPFTIISQVPNHSITHSNPPVTTTFRHLGSEFPRICITISRSTDFTTSLPAGRSGHCFFPSSATKTL